MICSSMPAISLPSVHYALEAAALRMEGAEFCRFTERIRDLYREAELPSEKPEELAALLLEKSVPPTLYAIGQILNGRHLFFGEEPLPDIFEVIGGKNLIAALRTGERSLRISVAGKLGRIGDPRACEALIETLSDPDAIVRGAALMALARIDDPSQLPRLVPMTERP